jgi:hypothetical protein
MEVWALVDMGADSARDLDVSLKNTEVGVGEVL